MSLKMSESEFVEKYKFDINDFYYACIDNILKTRYYCQSVSELAYDIAFKIHQIIGNENEELDGILYKLTENDIYGTKMYTHNIAIPYEDIYITFKIRWEGDHLSVCTWNMEHQNEIQSDEKYEIIDILDEVEEM